MGLRETQRGTVHKEMSRLAGFLRQQRLVALIGVIVVVALSSGAWVTVWGGVLPSVNHDVDWHHAESTLLVPTNVLRWLDDDETRPASTTFAAGQRLQVDAAFSAYYAAHGGKTLLGAPLTTALPATNGLMQLFDSGALLLPTNDGITTQSAGTDKIDGILSPDDMRDSATGIVRLALLPRLLTIGSEAPTGGDASTVNYADLRRAATPDELVSAPSSGEHGQPSGDVFIPEVSVSHSIRGHSIPIAIWRYITRLDVSPDGWQTDFGVPLTEAIPITVHRQGRTIHAQAQAFVHNVVLTYRDNRGNETFGVAAIGRDYLDTVGPPQLVRGVHTTLWVTRPTTIVTAPNGRTTQIHAGQDFALAWQGEGRWIGNRLWYHVRWQTPQLKQSGWVAARDVTLMTPGDVPGYAAFDALSPTLYTYLMAHKQDVGAVVFDVTRGRYYTYNETTPFLMASSVKVPILLTLLSQIEQQQRGLTTDEVSLTTAMIENSDNDAAQALFNEIGGADALDTFMAQAGINGFRGSPDAWGYSTITPLAMVRLLTLLHDGKVLAREQDRQYALTLMQGVEPDQRVGVGDTAPANATVAMKDGWVQDVNDLWAVNTSGIVTLGGETYIISVYTQQQTALDAAQDMLRSICANVAQGLLVA